MKRSLFVLLALPLAFAACAEEEEAPVRKSFTADYDLGIQVVAEGKTVSITKSYVQLGDTVTQVDALHPQANTVPSAGAVECRVDDTGAQTVVSSTTTSNGTVRIAGRQQAWIIPGVFNAGNAEAVDTPGWGSGPSITIWGDPSGGSLFLTEPDIDILVEIQANAQCDCDLDQYIDPVQVELFIFEDDQDEDDVSVTTFTQAFAGETTDIVTTTTDQTTTVANRRSLGTFGRFQFGAYVWETGNLNGLYNGGNLDYNATMVVPDDVEVGDTWLNNGGNLVAAVAEETVDVGGKNVRALHIIERDSTGRDLTATGLDGWCVAWYDSRSEDHTTAQDFVRRSAELNDDCVVNNGTGWTNLRHTWYYRGLPVRHVNETVSVTVNAFGFVIPNDTNIPDNVVAPGNTDTGVDGDCAFYDGATPNTFPTAIDLYVPYAQFDVVHSMEEVNATELRTDYTIVKEYNETE